MVLKLYAFGYLINSSTRSQRFIQINFTLVKSHETIIILTFADSCIVFFFVKHCPFLYMICQVSTICWALKVCNTTVSETKVPGLMELTCVTYTLKVPNHSIYLFFHSFLHSNSELITELLPHCNLHYS